MFGLERYDQGHYWKQTDFLCECRCALIWNVSVCKEVIKKRMSSLLSTGHLKVSSSACHLGKFFLATVTSGLLIIVNGHPWSGVQEGKKYSWFIGAHWY